MQSFNPPNVPYDASEDSSNSHFQPAEISRMTRNLRSKLAQASIKAQLSPENRLPANDPRRRTKTLEGANASPRPAETTSHQNFRINSRRSSANSLSSMSSMSPNNSLLVGASLASPHAQIPRINSVNSITESPFYPPLADQLMASPSNYSVPSSMPTPRSYPHPTSMRTPQSGLNQSTTTNPALGNPALGNQPMVTPQKFSYPPILTPPDTFATKQKLKQLELQDLQKQFQREYQEKVLHQGQPSPPFRPQADIFGESMDTTNEAASDDLPEHGAEPNQPLRLQQAFSISESIERPRADTRAVPFNVLDNHTHHRRKPRRGPELRIDGTRSGDDLFPEPATPPPIRRSMPKTPERRADSSTSDGASLLLHFAQSPGRGTPRTPDFNMSDYLQFQTPSPARNQLTPHHGRWGSLNSTLFSATNGSTLAPPAMPDLGRVTNTASQVSNP